MSAKNVCPCGCQQAPATNCRLRKVAAECGCLARISREMIGRGLFICPCGHELEPVCLHDRGYLPGEAGDSYARLVGGLAIEHEVRSENARKAIRRRRRCKLATCGALVGKGELYCRGHKDHEWAF
jgi:hypothetical protein